MTLAIIAAVADNGVIGRGNGLPWRLPADLARFKQLTTGHTIIMGRKTYESIGRPLPQRRSIVITSNPAFHPNGVEVARSFDDALRLAAGDSRAFAIGGAAVFEAALPHADELYLTRVHAAIEGDVVFPAFDERHWELVEAERREPDERNPYPVTFQVYRRR